MPHLPRTERSVWKPAVATVLRCTVIGLIAMGLRQKSVDSQAAKSEIPDIATVQTLLPNTKRIQAIDGNLHAAMNQDEQKIAIVRQTIPEAAQHVGYRSFANCLLVLNKELVVTNASLIETADTQEHVAAIVADEKFWKQFQGLQIGTPSDRRLDVVSGATLTSFAIIAGIEDVLGNPRLSLKFPNAVTRKEIEATFKFTVQNLQLKSAAEVEIQDQHGDRFFVIRTGPLSDSIIGYQGPTELLVLLNQQRQVMEVALRSTYDNQPYAGYLDDEPWFWDFVRQKTWPQLAIPDLASAGVEGVSGATMTSVAAAETLLQAAIYDTANSAENNLPVAGNSSMEINWTIHDCGTVAVMLCGILCAFTRLRRKKNVMTIWKAIIVLYFGLVTGHLLSLAVLSGWMVAGIPWQLAPGLASVLIVTVLSCVIGRRNVYCSHVCPHGIVQQLLLKTAAKSAHRRTRWRSVLRKLSYLPGITLFAAALVLTFDHHTDFAAWEPFHGWVWQVAGAAAIAMTASSLLLSAFLPMFYCRYACATGRLLNFIRRSSTADHFRPADLAACFILLLSWW